MADQIELKNRYNALSDEIIHKRKILAAIPIEEKRERMTMVQHISRLEDELTGISRELAETSSASLAISCTYTACSRV